MLKTTKSTTLNGTSLVDNEVAATMYAVINEDGSGNQNVNIVNNVIYENNKKEVRDDIAQFNNFMYELQNNEGGEN